MVVTHLVETGNSDRFYDEVANIAIVPIWTTAIGLAQKDLHPSPLRLAPPPVIGPFNDQVIHRHRVTFPRAAAGGCRQQPVQHHPTADGVPTWYP